MAISVLKKLHVWVYLYNEELLLFGTETLGSLFIILWFGRYLLMKNVAL